jgi:hypothetical protein
VAEATAEEEVVVGSDRVSMRSTRGTLKRKSTAKDHGAEMGCPEGTVASDRYFEGMSSAGRSAGNEVFY